ncbi:MAG: hypothetical protein DI635_15170 [Pseudoxanthomonas suwonensis]|nr:MAG: hypothetical protein DI635_15170 [Pseudoxanthomonas suwonensis]
MTQHPYPRRPRRRGFFPFPIILPGCCGCGGVATFALIVVGAMTAMFGLGEPAPEAQPSGTGTSVVQEIGD